MNMFFWSKERTFPPIQGKIEIFARHCLYSEVSQKKERLAGFSREKCFENFLSTLDRTKANVTFLLDIAKGEKESHFLHRYPQENLVCFEGGTESLAFLRLLDHIASLKLHPDTAIYIVEDDYLHKPGWIDVLLEGFSLPADYLTLYDHRDKYCSPIYSKLTSRLFISPRSHWRTTPSTTNTFAVRFGTLLLDLPVHRHFSRNRSISADHAKFCFLTRRGRLLISPIPGWSTHCEPEYASPCVDWEEMGMTATSQQRLSPDREETFPSLGKPPSPPKQIDKTTK